MEVAIMDPNPGTKYDSKNDTQIITDLMRHAIVDPSQDQQRFHESAVKSLIRRLRRSQEGGIVDNLVRAIKHHDQDTACVKIMRSLDGRMQILQKKTIPHVLFFQIWRCKDVKSYHELQAIVTCRYAYGENMSQTGGEICVNPYHYERRIRTHLPTTPLAITQHDGFRRPSSQFQFVQQNDGFYDRQPAYNNMVVMMEDDDDAIMVDGGSIGWRQTTEQELVMPNYAEEPNNNRPWISVVYMEKSERPGEKFLGIGPEIIIDGGFDPDTKNGTRLCLGQFSNANRDNRSEMIRNHIGNGIRIIPNHQEGVVTLINQNESHAVFVQSQNWNKRMNKPLSYILKLGPGGQCDIFNNVDFSKRLQATVQDGYESVSAIGNMCTIRLSFVKGWGEGYKLQHITNSPCWLEINLLTPLEWLDSVLEKMDGPSQYNPSSYS